MVFTSIQPLSTSSKRPKTNSRWSKPPRMWWMPWTRNAPATENAPGVAVISIQGCAGWTRVVVRLPSRCETRTSTSVMLACRPMNSIRCPTNPAGPASMTRRSISESFSLLSTGSTTVCTPSANRSATGNRMPESTGVRHSTSKRPVAVSLSSR
ncbi:hypothetical protein D3C76_764340 [compost metagenome]